MAEAGLCIFVTEFEASPESLFQIETVLLDGSLIEILPEDLSHIGQVCISTGNIRSN